MKSFLKWAGSKSKLITQISQYLPTEFDWYFEPFLGSGSLFFHLQPEKALLSDFNSELITTYTVVKSELPELCVLLQKYSEYYLYSEIRDFQYTSSIEVAARFIFLNRTCFNGLYRVNSQGKFNVPQGKYKDPFKNIFTLLENASEVLNQNDTVIMHSDYLTVLEKAEQGDFVYLDPPYYPVKDNSFTKYNSNDFSVADHIVLADRFQELTDRGVKVMVSNSDTPAIRDLYKGFNIYEIQRSGNMNSDTSKRGKVTELLIANY